MGCETIWTEIRLYSIGPIFDDGLNFGTCELSFTKRSVQNLETAQRFWTDTAPLFLAMTFVVPINLFIVLYLPQKNYKHRVSSWEKDQILNQIQEISILKSLAQKTKVMRVQINKFDANSREYLQAQFPLCVQTCP